MDTLSSSLTKEECQTIVEALDVWRKLTPDDTVRQEMAVLIHAKLLLQRKDHECDKKLRETLANGDRLTLAEQFICECGIETSFNEFLKEHEHERRDNNHQKIRN